MNETVLVGVTEAAAAQRAIEWAAQRAAERRDRIVLLTVISGSTGAESESAVLQLAREAAQGSLDEAAATVRSFGVECETRVVVGRAVDAVIEASTDAALLVIGSDYRGPGSGPERGPHGVRISSGAHCPVVVIPDMDLRGRSGVIVGVDGSEASEAALRFAAVEAERVGEPLTAIMTWSPVAAPLHMRTSYPGPYLENMQLMTEEALAIALAGVRSDHPDLEVRRVVESGYPETVINEYARSARLSVVGSHGRGAIARFLVGSTSQAVLQRLATATAVVR